MTFARTSRFALAAVTAALLAVASTGAAAASDLTQTQNITLAGDSSGLTGAPFVIHSQAGSFLDTLHFSYTGTGWVDASLVTIGKGDLQSITFTEVLLNGQSLAISAPMTMPGGNAIYSTATLPLTLLAGDYTLVVKGYAGGALSAGTTGIAASYSTTFNVLPASAVPEPESYAMFLAGLGLMAVMLGKRRRQN